MRLTIAAISDLHIGAHARTDTFQHDADAFQRFLDHLEATHDTIVLLGDIYQCDHGWRLGMGGDGAQLAAARARTPWLTERLAQPRYRLVCGNHDAITETALGAARTLRLGPVLLTHGDQLDPVLAAAPRVSAAATWGSGRLRAAGLRPLAGWLEGRDVALKGQRFQTPQGPYAAGAQALLAANPDVSVVVMGHTHRPWRQPLRGGLLLNTGTCSQGRWMYASIHLDLDKRGDLADCTIRQDGPSGAARQRPRAAAPAG